MSDAARPGSLPELTGSSVRELEQLLASRVVSAVDVCLAFIERINRLNPAINALVRFDAESALSQARQADVRREKGETHGLLGIPYTVKDNIWVAGEVCTQGSTLFRDFRAPHDAYAVARLREAGAVFLGFTNCSEFACKGVTTNPLFGTTRNPWNTDMTPGGSSGGAASAVAAGLCPLALGTDAGGSTRRPAAHTGVVGLKPTMGLIPHPTGFAEPVFGHSVIGTMVRQVADLYPVLAQLAVACGDDPLSNPRLQLPSFMPGSDSVARLKIGYSPDLGLGGPVEPDVAASVRAALNRLARNGHEVIALDPDWPEGAAEEALMPLQLAGLATLYGEAWQRREWDADPDIAAQIENGMRLKGSDVTQALYLRDALYRSMMAYFSRVDVLVTPTTPVTAWPCQQLGPPTIAGRPVTSRAHAVFTPIFNHTGMPAISVPCGLDDAQLPIGLQIVGPRYSDAMLIALAEEVERDAGFAWRARQLAGA